MNLKRSFSYSRSPALLALEHLALAVHGHVLPQVGVGGERLVALGAGERLDLLVNPERETTLSTHSAPECQKGFYHLSSLSPVYVDAHVEEPPEGLVALRARRLHLVALGGRRHRGRPRHLHVRDHRLLLQHLVLLLVRRQRVGIGEPAG